MNPLQQIPANVRAVLYWVGYVVGILGQGITIVWGAIAASSPDVEMPLGLVIASAVIGLLQTQLNLLSGSNVYQGQHRQGGGEGGHSRPLPLVAAGLVSAVLVVLVLTDRRGSALAVIAVIALALLLLKAPRQPLDEVYFLPPRHTGYKPKRSTPPARDSLPR